MNTPNFLRPLQLHQLLLRSRPPRGSNSCFYEEVVNVGKREAKESWEAVTCHVHTTFIRWDHLLPAPTAVNIIDVPLTIKRVRDVFELDSAFWPWLVGIWIRSSYSGCFPWWRTLIPSDLIETASETKFDEAIVVGQSDKNCHEPILRFEGLHLARTSNCQPTKNEQYFYVLFMNTHMNYANIWFFVKSTLVTSKLLTN